MKRSILLAGLLLGCSGGTAKIDVGLSTSTTDTLNPFAPETGIATVRVTVRGANTQDAVDVDDAIIDLAPGTVSATFETFPADFEVNVRAEGLDDAGSVVAFGKVENVEITEDVALDIPFRRNLAYVIHRANSGQASPSRHIYVIDMSTRTLVEKLQIPGTAPVAQGISARGGQSILVTYQDGGQGFVGVIDAGTHEFRSIPLTSLQTHAVASENSDVAVVAGGQAIGFLDLAAGTVEEFSMMIGGNVLDLAISADGRRAVVVLTTAALVVDVERREVKSVDVLSSPSGVGIARSGRSAILTSSDSGQVAQIDLISGDASLVAGSLARGVQGATFSEEMQAIFGPNINGEFGTARVIMAQPFTQEVFTLDEGQQTLDFPTGIATGAAGRRLVVVAAGTSTDTAGLTVIDTFGNRLPDSSSTLYPLDPDDSFLTPGGVTIRQRWQPAGVATIYGR